MPDVGVDVHVLVCSACRRFADASALVSASTGKCSDDPLADLRAFVAASSVIDPHVVALLPVA